MKYFTTDKSIVLYWDKPEELFKQYSFRIYVDGKLTGETIKTHFTVENLNSDTNYEIQISLCEKDFEEKYISEIHVIKTMIEKKRIDVTKSPYCAIGDGKTMNTKALQQAICDCDATSVVYLPKGIFMTGALKLHSDMEIYLEEGAVLQGTTVPEDYLPRIPSRFEGYEMECYSSLINIGDLDRDTDYNCKNIMIHGKGSIISGGRKLAKNIIELEKKRLADAIVKDMETEQYEKADTIPGRVRPRLVNISNGQNIVLSGITFAEGASWNIHMIYSDNIVTHNCVIKSKGIWNGDGWDPDSSTNCTVFATTFFTEDDSIAIKSGKNPEGNILNRPCEHIRIFDCVSKSGHGFAVGSEMSGGICDVKIWDCNLQNTRYGLEIKGTKKRGSYVKDVCVRDSVISRIMFHAVDYNDDGRAAETPPLFSDCSFENLHILGEYPDYDGNIRKSAAIELIGFEEEGYEIRNVRFKDILLQRVVRDGRQSIEVQYCDKISLCNTYLF